MKSKLPVVGQSVTVRTLACTITKLLPFGTLEAVAADGHKFRVSGLPFRLCLACGGAKPMTESCGCVDNGCQ